MKVCVLVPHYNQPLKISSLLAALSAYNLDILFIDDGSNAECVGVLKNAVFEFAKNSSEIIFLKNCEYIESIWLKSDENAFSAALNELCESNYIESKNIESSCIESKKSIKIFMAFLAQNRGKGAAVRAGAAMCAALGYSHIFQIDADMQQDLSAIPFFLAKATQNPQSVICAEPIYGEDAPKARLFGRKISRFWCFVNSLGKIRGDSMIGFRIYPLCRSRAAFAALRGLRMEFDSEILLNLANFKTNLLWEKVKIIYERGGISHFRGFADNVRISFMHTRFFFLMLKNLFFLPFKAQKYAKTSYWANENEKGSEIFLKITLWLVMHLPRFALRFCSFFVALFYFIFSSNQRLNLARFYENRADFLAQKRANFFKKNLQIFSNFYEFALCICDKMAVWGGKLPKNSVEFIDIEFIENELFGNFHKSQDFIESKTDSIQIDSIKSTQKGQILLGAHFGNLEIASALMRDDVGLDLTFLVYQKHSQKFNKILKKLYRKNIKIMFVNELDPTALLGLSEIIERGGHIGIMGDRSAKSGSKNVNLDFLGKSAEFSLGAFILARLLKCKISALWCYKRRADGKFIVELEPLNFSQKEDLRAQKDVLPFLEKYIKSLQNRAALEPNQWFNFYDFWVQNETKSANAAK